MATTRHTLAPNPPEPRTPNEQWMNIRLVVSDEADCFFTGTLQKMRACTLRCMPSPEKRTRKAPCVLLRVQPGFAEHALLGEGWCGSIQIVRSGRTGYTSINTDSERSFCMDCSFCRQDAGTFFPENTETFSRISGASRCSFIPESNRIFLSSDQAVGVQELAGTPCLRHQEV